MIEDLRQLAIAAVRVPVLALLCLVGFLFQAAFCVFLGVGEVLDRVDQWQEQLGERID